MNSRTAPAQQIAGRYLDAVMSAPPGGCLPGIRQMSAAAGVSYVTMQRVVAAAIKAGRLEGAPRRGLRLPGLCSVGTESLPAALPRHLQLAGIIETAIADGAYHPGGTLPSIKELASVNNTTHLVLRRALAGLAARGVVERIGRRWRLAPLRRISASGRVVLVTRGDRTGLPARTTVRTQANLHALEQQCASAGITLEVVLCDYKTGALSRMAGGVHGDAGLFNRDGLLGVVFWPVSLRSEFADRILDRAAGASCPVAVLWEEEPGVALPRRLAEMRLFQGSDGIGAGTGLGRCIASLGHRHVTFFSPGKDVAWSQQREEGVRAGLGSAAALDVWQDEQAEPSAGNDGEMPLQRAAALLESAVKALPADHERRAVALQLAMNAFSGAANGMRLAQNMMPLFERALERGVSTAWVCANDLMAIEALAFLRRRKVAVPKEISVAGFDNSEESFVHGLTSYDFNAPGLARAMVGHVLRWPAMAGREPGAQTDGITVVRGLVIERATTHETTRRKMQN